MNKASYINRSTGLNERHITAVNQLNEEGSTVAFIARYRKDATGNMDEVNIIEVIRLSEEYDELIKRKEFVLESIESQGKLSPELKSKIENCFDKTILEDLYLPYKQRKKTRADMAREKGLEPLAKIILSQRERDIEYVAKRYINDKVKDEEEAIDGASDIVAQWIADDADTRNMLRGRFEQHAVLETKLVKGKEKEGEKYRDYFNYTERSSNVPSHRFMAVMRAVEEGILKVSVEPDENKTLEALDRKWIKRDSACEDFMLDITKDAYKRLLLPSLENETKQMMLQKAETEAIKVFAENLQQLLLSSPLGSRRILAIDPGIRTGCKTVCLNENGNLLHHTVLYFNSADEQRRSLEQVAQLMDKYKLQTIAVGSGTAGRETADLIRKHFKDISLFMVNEDGASVYSVSEIARKEFPDQDVTVRGAVSIGRRLMDPLAELVKIDPKSLGVGQYQHDVNQTALKKALDETIDVCVNRVGVNLNTAGEALLSRVSGLGPALAKNIIQYRNEKGDFKSRAELKKVPRLGEKAFEQSAGFLRIPDAEFPLDRSAVHPEQYALVRKMAQKAGLELNALIGNKAAIAKLAAMSDIREEVGDYTFNDILKELDKPGLDPREELKEDVYDDSIRQMSDLKVGMKVNGVITNVTNFGAFVDIGIKENGLLHVSEMSNTFIRNPNEVVKLGQKLSLKVKELDFERKRISLTLKS